MSEEVVVNDVVAEKEIAKELGNLTRNIVRLQDTVEDMGKAFGKVLIPDLSIPNRDAQPKVENSCELARELEGCNRVLVGIVDDIQNMILRCQL